MYVKKWKYMILAAALFAAFTLIPFSASADQQTGSTVPAIATASAGVHSTITPVRWGHRGYRGYGYRRSWGGPYGYYYGAPYGYYGAPYPYPYYYGYPGYYAPGLSFNFGF